MMSNNLVQNLLMFTSLNNLNLNQRDDSYIIYLTPIIITLMPFITKIFQIVYEYLEDLIFSEKHENIISIKFPVHDIRVQKDGYGKDNGTHRQLYSINYIAINDYIKENLDKIDGISKLVEILNVNMNYYAEDTNEKNFVLVPVDSGDILIEPIDGIYCKIQSINKNNSDITNSDDKDKSSNEKIKKYELILFIKCIGDSNQEKRDNMGKLNKFINSCVKTYNQKKEDKYDNTHWIYEYTHSYKDEYSGLELKFKEYEFVNNKDLDTNIFFDEKEKLIKYVDKFIYNEEEVEKKIPNQYEQEYKSIGYTYKATFLFYGFPGCGKTSTIKAILNRTKRHGIIINWNKIKTGEELETLFRNRSINRKEYDSKELCFIIEDCDASKDNILYSRKNKDIEIDSNGSVDIIDDDDILQEDNLELDNKKNNTGRKDKIDSIEKILKKMSKCGSKTNIDLDLFKNKESSLNLSCLLNILDGIIELHGVMIIFTTNHPEKLDEAFLRPGRIDFKQEFKRATIQTIITIVYNKFKQSSDFIFPIHNFKDYVLSPAEIQSICFKNENIYDCIKELEEETSKYINRI